MPDQADARVMRRALRLAEGGWGRTAPNPLVGAIVVKGSRTLGDGFHAEFGGEHAEVAALRKAGRHAKGATLYVTLEPCNHQGKTPPCTRAIIAAGIKRVVIATPDPNPAAGGGIDRLRAKGVVVETGVEEARARELNAAFVNRYSSTRPWIALKLAMSVDGAIADARRSKGWITSAASRRMVHRMRSAADAVAVGLGTVLADNPSLTVRGREEPRVQPVRIVFSRSGALPEDSVLVSTARQIPTWLVMTGPPRAATRRYSRLGVRVIAAADLADAMRVIAGEGITSVLVEGGAGLTAALLDGGLVDRLTIFRAPILLGTGGVSAFAGLKPGALADAVRMPIVESRTLGGDQMTTYAITPI